MSELEPSTRRLRRRSFFENDTDDTVLPTDNTNSAMVAIESSNHGDPFVPPLPTSHMNGGPWGNQSFLDLVSTHLWYGKTWLIVKWQSLVVNARFARYSYKNTTSSPIEYTYSTHYLKLACLSLFVLQWIFYWYYPVETLFLHTEECLYQDSIMTPVSFTTSTTTTSSTTTTMNTKAIMIRFVQQRFEEQHQVPKQKTEIQNTIRKPWVCIAIVNTKHGFDIEGWTRLLPRAQVVPIETISSLTHRVQLVVSDGGTPFEPKDHRHVLVAFIPLSTFQMDLFPHGFPDIMIVTTEYALKKMVLFRHKQREALQQRRTLEEEANQHSEHPKESNLEPIDASSQFGVYLLKTSVDDIYDRTIEKNWDAFLHVVLVEPHSSQNKGTRQYTKELVALWLTHPTWPTLYLRFQGDSSTMEVCTVFKRYVTNVRRQMVQNESPVDDDGMLLPSNLDITCSPSDNSRQSILHLKNRIGIHLFPVPAITSLSGAGIDQEHKEQLVLESSSAGAFVLTYNSPIMKEWIPDDCGLRVGTFDLITTGPTGLDVPIVQLTSADVEHGILDLLMIPRVHRVRAGRNARIHYLQLRTHYVSAMTAMDTAICDLDSDENVGDAPNEIGQRSRKTVLMEMLSVFLY